MQVSNIHESCVGITQSGKTYYSIQKGERFAGGAFFFNPQRVPNKFLSADGKNEFEEIYDELQKGHKVDYIPNLDDTIAKKELRIIIDSMFSKALTGKRKPILFIADECTIYAKNSGAYTPLDKIATRGLSLGIIGHFITQYPQDVSKLIMRNCEMQTYFESTWSNKYYESYGIPIDDIQSKIKSGGKYSYCQYYRGQLLGAFRE